MKYMPGFIAAETSVPPQQLSTMETQLLREKSHDGLAERLASFTHTEPADIYTARLNNELQQIEGKSVSGYFLIVADYVNWARKNEIAVGPGRGSGPCSLVGFALGITDVDPIRYNLPFERFLNPDRNSNPDFDLEFCDKRRHEVLTYIQHRYGSDRVAHISAEDSVPLQSRLVISDRPLAEVIPLHSKSPTAIPATKITLEQIPDSGLVQFNVINQSALNQIQSSVRILAKKGHIINASDIPLHNNPTYSRLSTGQVSNIDLLDNKQYKSALIAVQPDRFEELCAVIAMHRTPFQIPHYIHHKQTPEAINPALDNITKESYGLILYQEQIINIAHELAGFTLAQGDLLRRALQRSDQDRTTNFKNNFIKGAERFGLPTVDSTDIFDHLAESGKYAFCKAHAVAVALITYQTEWLKLKTQSL